MKTIRLRNGTEEAEPLVKVTVMSLQRLVQEHPISFYELVQVARDRSHRPFGNSGDVLASLSLLQPGGRMHQSIRNIVLSATDGEQLDVSLCDPSDPQHSSHRESRP